MNPIPNWSTWESRFIRFLEEQLPPGDPAHDLAHIRRVVANAHALAIAEGARLEIVLPAAWLHDCVVVPKDSPQRSRASTLAAGVASAFLRDNQFPATHIPAIAHAIAAHSFSAGIAPQTLEAMVVQDADRLDALGAIGIARCLQLGGALGKPLYNLHAPFPTSRPPDDTANILDHFYVKLLNLADMMHTASGQAEARARTAFMQQFLDQLGNELA
jgi:uncharacterized protein